MERQRRRYKAAGLVQLNVWVPACDKVEVLTAAAKRRHAYLAETGALERWALERETEV